MPRLYFTGRKKLAQDQVSLTFRPGQPPEFSASIDFTKNRRTLPPAAKVIVEAYHNTLLQRFDFGTVADCRPRDPLRLTSFDQWDRPRFRVRVVDADGDSGRVLAACDRVSATDPDDPSEGGRSLLKLFPKPNEQMGGELWRVEKVGEVYQLAYNRDVAALERGIKSKEPMMLGLMLPAALREILARETLWGSIDTEERGEWVALAQAISGEPPPAGRDGETPQSEDIESWIDGVVRAFCRNRGRFFERVAQLEDGA